MADVFISYSREDQPRAESIAKLLESQGFSTWWDRKIPPGKTWDQVIGQALEESRCVVVLWTSESVKSNWVKEEASQGAQRDALVPISFDRTEPPLGFGRIESADFSDWQGETDHPEVCNFLAAVDALVRPGPLPPSSAPPNRVIEQRATSPSNATILGAPRNWLLAGLSALVLLGATITVWWLLLKPNHQLDVRIWDVEGDRKTHILATGSFDASGDDLPNPLIESMVQWMLAQLVPGTTAAARPLTVKISIPADPGTEKLRIEPPADISVETHLYIIQDTGKVRVRSDLNQETLALLQQDFVIEVGLPGYASVPLKVNWGTPVEKQITLKPAKIKLAVEEFSGPDNRIAEILANALSKHPRLKLYGPDALARLRREIENSRASIGVHRAAQIAIRDSLGVDYIISGDYGFH